MACSLAINLQNGLKLCSFRPFKTICSMSGSVPDNTLKWYMQDPPPIMSKCLLIGLHIHVGQIQVTYSNIHNSYGHTHSLIPLCLLVFLSNINCASSTCVGICVCIHKCMECTVRMLLSQLIETCIYGNITFNMQPS